jgi:bifunctional DNA-binding transcriptional regulator/antitoxin component of YhaV-PrlF toxin-antitoxin module
MNATITMDAAGRLVVPKAFRERYGLVNGVYELEASDSPEGIVLRPKGEAVPSIRRTSGWVVFTSGPDATVDPVDAITAGRRRRQDQITDTE